MAEVHIINPTYTRSTKTLRERLGKYKHRPVYYSQSPGKLGARSEFKKLNPKKGVSTMAAKKKTKYRAKKRSNPQGSRPAVKYKYRYRSKAKGYRKAKRRNPDGSGSISIMSVGQVILGGVAGAVGYKVTTGLFQTEGNGKYLVAIVLALGGGWLLSKFYRPLAAPFVAGVAGSASLEYLSENDVLSGLLGQSYTPTDIGVLQEWKTNYDTGVLGMVPQQQQLNGGLGMVPQSPGIQLNNEAMYSAMAGGGGDKL